MVRNYKKKRDTSVNEEDLKKTMQHVLNKMMTLRGAADTFGITKSTLGYRLKNIKNDKRSKKVKIFPPNIQSARYSLI